MNQKHFALGVVFVSFLLFILAFASGDVISVNSGGGENITIGSGFYSEGFFSCIPQTCSGLGFDCGTYVESCGLTLNCGSCSSSQTCTNNVCTATSSSSSSSSSGGGGGGGGGGTVVSTAFDELTVVPDSFNLPATSNVKSTTQILISNVGNTSLDIKVSLVNLENIVSVSDNSFSLESNSEKLLTISIISPKDPGIYTGKIVFSSGNKKLEVPFAINVNSELSLFDISIDVPPNFKSINIGNKINSQITLVQAGLQQNVDVLMRYSIKDFNGRIYSEETETIAVFKQKTFTHQFDTSKLAAGDYLVGAEVIYSGGVATGSSQFKVLSQGERSANLILIAELAIAIFVLVVLISIARSYRRESLRRSTYKSESIINTNK